MAMYAALLRGVNIANRKMVAMADLRRLATGLGLGDAQTLLQSGNLIFSGGGRINPAQLEKRLQDGAAGQLGLETDFFVRSTSDWREVVARNPFPDEAKSDPSHLVVMFLREAPPPAAVKELQAAITGPEVVRAVGRHAYITYPAGIGRSRLTVALIDKKLGTRGTGRNWNTVLKIAALMGA